MRGLSLRQIYLVALAASALAHFVVISTVRVTRPLLPAPPPAEWKAGLSLEMVELPIESGNLEGIETSPRSPAVPALVDSVSTARRGPESDVAQSVAPPESPPVGAAEMLRRTADRRLAIDAADAVVRYEAERGRAPGPPGGFACYDSVRAGRPAQSALERAVARERRPRWGIENGGLRIAGIRVEVMTRPAVGVPEEDQRTALTPAFDPCDQPR